MQNNTDGEDDYIILDDGKLSRLQFMVNQKRKEGYKPQNMILNNSNNMYSVAMIREPNKNINFKAFKRNVQHDMDAIRFNIKNQSARIKELEELRKGDLEYIVTMQDKVKSMFGVRNNNVVKNESNTFLSTGYDNPTQAIDLKAKERAEKEIALAIHNKTIDCRCLPIIADDPITGEQKIVSFVDQYHQQPKPEFSISFDLSNFRDVQISDNFILGSSSVLFESDYHLDDILGREVEFFGGGFRTVVASLVYEECELNEVGDEVYRYKFQTQDKE